ncbi:hypothetical protein LR48_Vigan04g127100 [Vigna angularis]|uniref:Putative plant transposon protein domain-containing protein n=1 Tax=Phaseolus angularis TaxID=3914 RepID=A0A0L9UEB2_PHAAN|nr:hypothetical protein LR48_Vigan04g127100 [Vigna angularis]
MLGGRVSTEGYYGCIHLLMGVAKEFYTNVRKIGDYPAEDYLGYVRGHAIRYDPDSINHFLGTVWVGEQCQFAVCMEEGIDFDDVESVLCVPGGHFQRNKTGSVVNIRRTDLNPLAKYWMAFYHANIQPCSHVSDITLSRALLLYCAIRNLNVNMGQCQFAVCMEEGIDFDDVESVLCVPGGHFQRNKTGSVVNIRRTDLNPLAKYWMEFSHANIQPCSHVSDITLSRALRLYCVIRNLNVNIGQVIANEIQMCANTINSKGPLGHPSLITHLSKIVGVDTSAPRFDKPRKGFDEAYYRQYCGGEEAAQPIPPRRPHNERGQAQSQASAKTHEADPYHMRDMYMSLIAHRWTMDEFHNVVAWPEEQAQGGRAGAAEASTIEKDEDDADTPKPFSKGMTSSSGKRVKTMASKRKDKEPKQSHSSRFLSRKHEKHFKVVQDRRVLMEKKVGMIPNFAPQFGEQLLGRNWGKLATYPAPANIAVAKEFYTNVRKIGDYPAEDYLGYVRGHAIRYDPDSINHFLGTVWVGEQCQFAVCMEEGIDFDDVESVLCVPGGHFQRNKTGSVVNIRRTDLNPLAKYWMEFSHANIQPCSHVSDITLSRALRLYCVIRNLNVNIGQVIANEIQMCANTINSKGPLGHPSLITHLSKIVGVDTSAPRFDKPRKGFDEAYYRQYCGGEEAAQPIPPRRPHNERGQAQSQASAKTHEADPYHMRDMYMSLIGAQLQSIHKGPVATAEMIVGMYDTPQHTGFKVNLMKEVKKDIDGIRKELKKCKRREAASTAQRQFIVERH